VSIGDVQNFFLVLTRTLAILSAVPVLGGRIVPARVRLGFGILLAIVIYSTAFPVVQDANGVTPVEPLVSFGINVVRELVVGTLAGTAIRFAVSSLEAAARLMNDSVGFGAATLLNPTMETPGTAFDQFYVMAATLIFFVSNGHHQLLRGLVSTFEIVPLRTFELNTATAERAVLLSANVLVGAAQIALPIMAAMILIDVALGIATRAAPQMNVFFVGIPIKLAVGLLAIGLILPLAMSTVGSLFDTALGNMFQLIR
jgi:flagellar biosynthetic protein FliR